MTRRRVLGLYLGLPLILLLLPLLCGGLLLVLARTERARPAAPAGWNVEEGMTKAEIKAVKGPPDEVHQDDDGREAWIYYRDWLGVRFFGIRFSPEGTVEGVWN